MTEAVSIGRVRRRRNFWYIRGTLKVMALLFVGWFLVLPLIPGFKNASRELGSANVAFLVVGFALEMAALLCYSLLTKSALPEPTPSTFRLFRIQLSTRGISSIMPGGSAVGSALGYRLLTLSGVRAVDAGFALATVGLGSAVVLNVVLFASLLISIPTRGMNPFYGTAAAIGVAMLTFAFGLLVGLLKGQHHAEGFIRWMAKFLRLNPDRAVVVVGHVADRMRDLLRDQRMMRRVIGYAAANWLLDAAALWMFLRAFGGHIGIDGLLVSFCLANVLAVIPITPGGLGVVEGVYIPTLTGFGLTRSQATVGVLAYRLAQYWIPMVLGAIAYLSLRVGPFSIERRDGLAGVRQVAHDSLRDTTDSIEWADEYAPRHPAP